MPPTARAFWVMRPGVGALRDEPLPDPGVDEVLVRTRYTGISRGTEALVFTGQVFPQCHVGQQQTRGVVGPAGRQGAWAGVDRWGVLLPAVGRTAGFPAAFLKGRFPLAHWRVAISRRGPGLGA